MSKDIAKIITDKASNLTFDAEKIVSKGSGFTSTIMREIVVIVLGDNLQDIIKVGKINIDDKIGDLVNSCLKNGKKEKINNLAYDVITSMANDSNYPEDNNTVIEEVR